MKNNNLSVDIANPVDENTIKKIETAINAVCEYIEKTIREEKHLCDNEISETTKALAELVSARAQLTETVMNRCYL